MLKWGGITFGIGIALVLLEIYVASKKKGGIESQDRQRILGILWLAVCMSGMVMGLIWLS